jgi:Peptidase propeptide and YPEB domain
MKRFISPLIVAGFALAAIGIADAQDLTAAQVKSKLEAAGYTDVQNVKKEGNHFDATAMKDGKQMRLDVDAKTGAIKPEEENEKNERQESRGR